MVRDANVMLNRNATGSCVGSRRTSALLVFIPFRSPPLRSVHVAERAPMPHAAMMSKAQYMYYHYW